MFLVQVNTKAEVSTLLGGLALPGDARFHPTEGDTGAAGVHLTQVNGDAIDVYIELVTRSPVINLVDGKSNCHPVSDHLVWTRAAGNSNGLGHLLTACAKKAQELSKARFICCRPRSPLS